MDDEIEQATRAALDALFAIMDHYGGSGSR
jgi:hypothetical protein